MKSNFKRLGLATAVSAAAVGYAGMADAQSVSRAIGNLGDTAIIPYYTVRDNWVTGVHIINSSADTQVVKLRLRRATDSADALDFNLILSPKDEWTGFIDDSSGDIVFATDDNSCTAPLRADGRFPMPFIFREGAEEGYIEVIGMGQPDADSAIAHAAEHVAGVPRDCVAVASNFFANGSSSQKGIVSNDESTQAVSNTSDYIGATDSSCTPAPTVGGPGLCSNDYDAAGNGLKVSYFFRDATAGTEMGGNAVHLANFAEGDAWMSNQETGLFSGDVFGFDYPDLNGGPFQASATPTALRGSFVDLRDPAVLGVAEVLNDWSVAPARNVSTDWVITMPGQYSMVDYYIWAAEAGFDFDKCGQLDDPSTAPDESIYACDFRDLPVTADLTLYDREEGEIVPEDGDLVISPAPPTQRNELTFPYEVNVVEWTDGSNAPVMGSEYNTTVDPTVLGEFGWASLAVESTDLHVQRVCLFAGPDVVGPSATGPRANCSSIAPDNVPIVGFTAWQRSFPSNPDANYGRLIDHSFVSSN